MDVTHWHTVKLWVDWPPWWNLNELFILNRTACLLYCYKSDKQWNAISKVNGKVRLYSSSITTKLSPVTIQWLQGFNKNRLNNSYYLCWQVIIYAKLSFSWVVQGVPQYCIHFCVLNFSASSGSKNSILDIFQQPFSFRFQNCPICYDMVKSWPRYCQNTTRNSS